jgi:DNA relaxase NicK
MNLLPAHKIESVGVDWLTATAYRNRNHEEFYEHGKSLIAINARLGNDISNWKAQGYHGVKCGGVRVGLRHDTFIVQLSSDDARERWKDVAALSSNVSRVDLQVTYAFERAHKKFFIEEHQRAIAAKAESGRTANVTLITSTLSGDSIYLGQRSSDIYARCYDKGRESRQAEAFKVIRHEIELKRDVARRTVERLIQSDDSEALALGLVSAHFDRKHLSTSGAIHAPRESARACVSSDNSRRLRWLHGAVAPSVAVLLEAGECEAVLKSLGLLKAVQELCRSGKLKSMKEDKSDGR